jgi:ADP-ribose pyrophosphatase
MEYPELVEKEISSEPIFEGKMLRVYCDTVELPNGDSSTREYIRHNGAACVVPLTDDGRILMVRQYRYPVGQTTWEIPAGKRDSREEDPFDTARRELKEETGAEASEWILLGDYYPAAAYTDENVVMYLAKGLSIGDKHLDSDEFLNVEAVPFETVVSEIMAGKIPDGKTQAAVLRAYLLTMKS